MGGTRDQLRTFSRALGPGAFVAYFLGAVVPLVALGFVTDRYIPDPFAPPASGSSPIGSLGYFGLYVSIAGLTLNSFLMLRRLVRHRVR